MISHAILHWAFVNLFATLAAVSLQPAEAADFVELKREKYQKEIDGKKVDLYTIRNRGGMAVKITNWGAKVQQILVPDRTACSATSRLASLEKGDGRCTSTHQSLSMHLSWRRL